MFSIRTNARGFSLTELMLVTAVAGTLMAIAVPVAKDLTANTKLNEAARLIEREFQDARLRAVSANRSLRVRTNCPSTGFVRSVEVLGTTADNATNRCAATAYPYPPADIDVMTRPNYDGPLRTIPNSATVTSTVIEFSPDGTARLVVNGVAQTMTTEQVVIVTRETKTRTVRINGAGKVTIQ
jgi:prepilin-type N-terminal cleavage/methylation domain-containing protein